MAGMHFLPEETKRYLAPYDMGLIYTSAQCIEVTDEAEIQSGEEELCLVVLSGRVNYQCNGKSGSASIKDMLYVPIHTSVTLNGTGTIFRFGAPSARETSFAYISFAEADASARHKIYGKEELGTRRDVWNMIDEEFDSSRFLVGLCQGRSGGWTAWPPHRHGEAREEVYVYFGMGEGFALQCVYEDDGTPLVYKVEDGHLVAICEGFHPNVGCPGSGISYVYCMVSRKAEDREFMDLVTEKKFGERLE